jgi:hypothetical protein
VQGSAGAQNNDPRPLFDLVFDVDLSVTGRSPIEIVYTTDYTGASGGNELDLKYNLGNTARYATRINGEVTVPVPGSALMLLTALVVVYPYRRRRSGQQRLAA